MTDWNRKFPAADFSEMVGQTMTFEWEDLGVKGLEEE